MFFGERRRRRSLLLEEGGLLLVKAPCGRVGDGLGERREGKGNQGDFSGFVKRRI